jgi:hypothetical protein
VGIVRLNDLFADGDREIAQIMTAGAAGPGCAGDRD